MHPLRDYDCWQGEFYAYHRNYSLGHNEGKGDYEEDLKRIWSKLYPDMDYHISFYKEEELVEAVGEEDAKNYDKYGDRKMDVIMAEIEAKAILAPVYMFEHGNIALSVSSFGCPWDSGQVGLCFMDM